MVAGETDITKEIQCALADQQFVLHDSQGFEPGEYENMSLVEEFLRNRQVDAVW